MSDAGHGCRWRCRRQLERPGAERLGRPGAAPAKPQRSGRSASASVRRGRPRSGSRGESAESIGRRRFSRQAPRNLAPGTPFPARVPAVSKGRGPLGAARGSVLVTESGVPQDSGQEPGRGLDHLALLPDFAQTSSQTSRARPDPGTSRIGSVLRRIGRVLHSRAAIAKAFGAPLSSGTLLGCQIVLGQAEPLAASGGWARGSGPDPSRARTRAKVRRWTFGLLFRRA